MLSKIKINDVHNSPLRYLSKVFHTGDEFNFTKGINIIVGENGSGKSTLIKLIKMYTTTGDNSEFNHWYICNNLFNCETEPYTMYDGVDVYCDYKLRLFNYQTITDMRLNKQEFDSFDNFGATYVGMSSSTGQSNLEALRLLFKKMFTQGTRLNFHKDEIKRYVNRNDKYISYIDYIKRHMIDCDENIFTILLDEVDANLDIKNINEIFTVLSYEKPDTQVIACVHNPLLLYKLSLCKNVNFIELTPNYVQTIVNQVNDIVPNFESGVNWTINLLSSDPGNNHARELIEWRYNSYKNEAH